MLESIVATVSDISILGLLFLVGITVISIGRNIISSEPKLWSRTTNVVFWLPIWIAVLVSGNWYAFAAYVFVVNIYGMATMKYALNEESLDKIREVDEAGMLGCLLFFAIPLAIFFQSLFFLLFQWIR